MRASHLASLALAALTAFAAACTEVAASPPPRGALRITEVAAAGVPTDWIEVLNVSSQRIELIDYVFVDARDNLGKARPFRDVVLAPGERHVELVFDAACGFALAADEEVWIYRAADGALVDGIDWRQGATPTGGSLARSDDTGALVSVTRPSPGLPNGALP